MIVRARRRLRGAAGVVFALLFVVSPAFAAEAPAAPPAPTLPPLDGTVAATARQSTSSADASPADVVRDFLDRHWQRPLPANGAPPPHFSPVEVSLDPAACGQCHSRQYEDWRSSLHSRALGPGLLGQLQAMGPATRDEHAACLECHAPLAEQADHLVRSLAAGRTLRPDAAGVSAAHGITCAGCHVRGHTRYGPPRADGSAPAPGAPLPHDGWQISAAYEDSRFCSTCHQFGPDGPALNGKPFENTYAEWQASRHAREGRTCQSCHMPERRHLWRGIHDADAVRAGLTIATTAPIVVPAARGASRVEAEMTITNSGVGHAFPTYVTPQVFVEIAQEDARGKAIAGSVDRHLIARQVRLDLSEEIADTRLMSDEKRPYVYRKQLARKAVALVFRVIVHPDAFYKDFYRAVLADPEFKIGRSELQKALRQAEASPYELYRERRLLGPPSPSRAASLVR